MPDDFPKHRLYVLDLSKPIPNGWQYIGCVCEFADECQITHEDLQKGVKCKAYWAHKVKSSKEGHESGSKAN